MNAWVSYARASTEEQTASCSQQHRESERKAACPPAAKFEDDGVPGRIPVDGRTGLKQLCDFLRATPQSTFEVRCYDTSRLGRFDDPEYHFVAEWLLKQAGARRVVYTKGAFTEGRSVANSVLKIVEAHANRAYSEKLSRDVHRGLIAAVREGKRSGGFAPFGYDLEYPDQTGKPYARVRFVPVGGGRRAFEKHVTYLEDGRVKVLDAEHTFRPETKYRRSRLVPGDPKKIEAVRFIFDAYLRKQGYRTIAQDLQEQGYVAPEGNGWSITAVRSIVVNPVYTGRAVYGRRSESKYHRLEAGGTVRELAEGEAAQKRQMHIADEDRWITVEGAHEALIPEETWRAANARREEGAAARPIFTGRKPYMLSGMLMCPRCSANYVGARTKSGKGCITPYYTCGTYQRGKGCTRGGVREESADQGVIKKIEKALRIEATEDQFREELEAVFGALASQDRPSASDPREAELADAQRELEKIVKGVSPENLPLFDGRLTELRRKRDQLQAALARKRLEAATTQALGPAPLDLDKSIVASLDFRRQFVEATKDRDEVDVLTLRNELLPNAANRIKAFDKYLEIEAYSPAEAVAAGKPLFLWEEVCRGSGRGDPRYPSHVNELGQLHFGPEILSTRT